MSEFTSLEVSERLVTAGFKEGTDHCWPIAPLPKSGIIPRIGAYNVDTLLAWLLEHGWGIVTAIINDKYVAKRYHVGGEGVVINNIEYPIERPIVEALTLSDALAEVVIRVMEAEP